MNERAISYTAASSLPMKLFKNLRAMEGFSRHAIVPVHVQFNPTNRCNLKCEFCSCGNRDQAKEMPIEEVKILVSRLSHLGTQAVTITGGGEPLMHRNFDDVISEFFYKGMEIGLVSNGKLLDKVDPLTLKKVRWCRVSCSDDRPLDGALYKSICSAVERVRSVDWAFSYVITKEPNIRNILIAIEIANDLDFTHVRLVNDLMSPDDVPSGWVHEEIVKEGLDDSRVIYQDRKEFSKGTKKCYLSLLKPVIDADGFIYPCCGVQYARDPMDLKLHPAMRMGHVDDLVHIYERQIPFDGSVCARCYYENYNTSIAAMLSHTEHVRFV